MTKPLIIGINGSPRKNGSTAKLLKRALKSIEKYGGKIYTLHLIDKKIKPCLGHYSTDSELCRYPCKVKDDMQRIYSLLIKADGIIFASPVYWFNVSGLMKNFLDRLTCLEESGFYLEGKVAGFVVSLEESGAISTLSTMVIIALNHGMIVPPYSIIYCFSDKRKNLEWNKRNLELLGKNMLVAVKAQKYLEESCLHPWDYT